jgi:hypothetical protein
VSLNLQREADASVTAPDSICIKIRYGTEPNLISDFAPAISSLSATQVLSKSQTTVSHQEVPVSELSAARHPFRSHLCVATISMAA